MAIPSLCSFHSFSLPAKAAKMDVRFAHAECSGTPTKLKAPRRVLLKVPLLNPKSSLPEWTCGQKIRHAAKDDGDLLD
jgi:hypothetical protein